MDVFILVSNMICPWPGSMFTPVPVEMTATEPEIAGLDLLHRTKQQKMLVRNIFISDDVVIHYFGSVCS